MANRGELRAEVRELIGYGIFDTCFDPTWVDEALEFACQQTVALLGLTFTMSAPIAVANRYFTLPDDTIRPVWVRVQPGETNMGRMLLPSNRTIEDMKNPLWRDRVAEPTVWVEETGATIRLNGQPSTNAVIVGYIQLPAAMGNDNATPDSRIPQALHPSLKYGAAAYLLNLEGQGYDPKKANDLFSKFGVLIGVGELKIAEEEVDL